MCSTKAARLRLCHWGGVAQSKRQCGKGGGEGERQTSSVDLEWSVGSRSLSLSHSIAGGARLPASLAEWKRGGVEEGGGGSGAGNNLILKLINILSTAVSKQTYDPPTRCLPQRQPQLWGSNCGSYSNCEAAPPSSSSAAAAAAADVTRPVAWLLLEINSETMPTHSQRRRRSQRRSRRRCRNLATDCATDSHLVSGRHRARRRRDRRRGKRKQKGIQGEGGVQFRDINGGVLSAAPQ